MAPTSPPAALVAPIAKAEPVLRPLDFCAAVSNPASRAKAAGPEALPINFLTPPNFPVSLIAADPNSAADLTLDAVFKPLCTFLSVEEDAVGFAPEGNLPLG